MNQQKLTNKKTKTKKKKPKTKQQDNSQGAAEWIKFEIKIESPEVFLPWQRGAVVGVVAYPGDLTLSNILRLFLSFVPFSFCFGFLFVIFLFLFFVELLRTTKTPQKNKLNNKTTTTTTTKNKKREKQKPTKKNYQKNQEKKKKKRFESENMIDTFELKLTNSGLFVSSTCNDTLAIRESKPDRLRITDDLTSFFCVFFFAKQKKKENKFVLLSFFFFWFWFLFFPHNK